MESEVKKQDFLAIRKIFQKDPYHFVIEWKDGERGVYHLASLQKACPCARCLEEGGQADEDVQAVHIKSVGRYALRVQFTSGCNQGIYSYRFLKNYSEKEQCT